MQSCYYMLCMYLNERVMYYISAIINIAVTMVDPWILYVEMYSVLCIYN